MSMLNRALRKVRGLLGLGVFGGVAGTIVGALMAVADRVIGSSSVPLLLEMAERGSGGLLAGAACGIGFGALLTALEGKRSLDELPLWRMALLGAAVGVAVPTVFILLTSGTIHFVQAPEIVATVAATFGGLGGALSAAAVGLAKSAHRTEMAAVEEVAGLLEGD